MALPKIGLQAVLENSAGFTKSLDAVNKKTAETTAKMKEAAKNSPAMSSGLDKISGSVDGLKNKLSQMTGINTQATSGILEFTGALGPMAVAVGAAAIGIGALVVGVLALGARGAPLVGLGESFDRLTASVGLSSQALLVDLRKAANGTVSDFDLIKRANLALVGSTGEFGKQFGQKLPQVLAAARAAAKATGQDVDFLFQSLVAGIKRASPRLIDNTGIVLKLGAANQALADTLGKSVEQLTDEEKQIAVLNATVEAGAALIDSLGNSQETAAEKMARAQAHIANILDGLSIAVQPIFGAILDVVNNVLGGIENFVRKVAPFINFIAKMVGDLIKGIGKALFGEGGIGQKLGQGAYDAFKSFAAGISFAANKIIFPAVIAIAKFIADLLIGLSPPPKGPLSVIDKGGENLMKAWLDGIAGVSLDPVTQVAAEVSALLGDVGKATLPMVNARLAELDTALLPFQNRLDIVKSQFDAIAEPAKAALDAIDRQTEAAQAALASGDVSAANTLRQLDAARAAIQGQLDLQQQQVDKQQIQLGLATASQSQERALLNIRKAQLAVTTKTAGAAATVAGKLAPEKKPTGGAAPAPEAVAEGSGGLGIPTSSVLDQFGAASIDPQQVLDFATQFAGEQNMQDFAANQGLLQEQLEKIGSVDVGSKLKDKFKGLTDIFDPANEDSVVSKITKFVTDLAGDSDNPYSIAHFFAQIPASVVAVQDSITAGINDAVSSIFTPITNFLTGSEPGSIQDILNSAVIWFEMFPGQIVLALQGLAATLYTAVAIPVINVMNSMILLVENGVKGAIKGITDFLSGVVDAIDNTNLGIDTSAIHNVINDLNTKAGKISFGQISTALPSFITGAATGGMFGGGLLKVGERGPELIGAADKIGVLPAGLTKALEGLSSIMAAPPPMQTGGNTTNNSSSSSFTFNGVQSDNDARRRYNALRAGMR